MRRTFSTLAVPAAIHLPAPQPLVSGFCADFERLLATAHDDYDCILAGRLLDEFTSTHFLNFWQRFEIGRLRQMVREKRCSLANQHGSYTAVTL